MNDYLIEEWKNLREEIGRKQQLNYRIIFSTLGLNFLLYSYLLVEKKNHVWMDSLVVLLPVVIVGISHYWHLKNEHSALRIATYIRFYIEESTSNDSQTSKGPISWETKLSRFINSGIEKKRIETAKNKRNSTSFRKAMGRFLRSSFLQAFEKGNGKTGPREVNLLLYPFYHISPLIALFILGQSDVVLPFGLEKSTYTLGFAFFILVILSFVIFLIWEFTIIRIGTKEIEVLRLVSAEIESSPDLLSWESKIDNWKEERSFKKEMRETYELAERDLLFVKEMRGQMDTIWEDLIKSSNWGIETDKSENNVERQRTVKKSEKVTLANHQKARIKIIKKEKEEKHVSAEIWKSLCLWKVVVDIHLQTSSNEIPYLIQIIRANGRFKLLKWRKIPEVFIDNSNEFLGFIKKRN